VYIFWNWWSYEIKIWNILDVTNKLVYNTMNVFGSMVENHGSMLDLAVSLKTYIILEFEKQLYIYWWISSLLCFVSKWIMVSSAISVKYNNKRFTTSVLYIFLCLFFFTLRVHRGRGPGCPEFGGVLTSNSSNPLLNAVAWDRTVPYQIQCQSPLDQLIFGIYLCVVFFTV
jgi:hypothetical protein